MPKKKSPTIPKNSEFRAYPWIEACLRSVGWNTDNPNTFPGGEVWTQNECLEDPQIKVALGTQRPENVVKVSSNQFWVIEAKPGQSKLEVALTEAKDYADRINTLSSTAAVLASGVAGNDAKSGFLVRHAVRLDGSWLQVTEQGKPLERFLTRDEIKRLIAKKTAKIERDEISQQELVDLSNFINRQLHIAKITKEARAILVSILLIALHEDPSLSMSTATTFLNDINTRAENIFKAAGKQELWEQVKITFTTENVEPIAAALSRITVKLHEADIVSAIADSDVLGPFFESFLKYGNTSKDLGIVLTPRHICWLGKVCTSDRQMCIQ